MENSSSSAATTISSLNREFLIETIMSRLDGPTLSASASACSDLRAAASDQNLWKNLCTATWPSTASSPAVAAALGGNRGFYKFYADAFPLILCQTEPNPNPTVSTQASPSNLVSFVDIYYKGKCILSKALDAIPEPADVIDGNTDKDDDDIGDELRQWLLDTPFRLDMLPSYDDTDILPINDYNDTTSPRVGDDDDCITHLGSLTTSTENGKRGLDLRGELAQDIRMSWILFDKKNGKAVNLSSWKPVYVHKSWVPDGEYVLHFGSVVGPVVDPTSLLPTHKFAECKIVARCRLVNNNNNNNNDGGYAKWTEISMRVEDMGGSHLNTTKSLGVLNQALCSKRSTKHLEVEKADDKYRIYKKEMKRRRDRREYLVDKLYALVAVTVFAAIVYGCTRLFQ